MSSPKRIRWKLWVGWIVGLTVLLCAIVVVCVSLLRSWYHNSVFGRIDRSRQALIQPENYKPAAVALARLVQTDPVLLKADGGGILPDWTPPELGRLGPLEITIQSDGGYMTTTGGLAEFTGYKVELDKSKSTATTSEWTLILAGIQVSDNEVYHFSLQKTDCYTEDELVRSALAELDRRKAARAAGTDLAIAPDQDDPNLDRRKLLFEHPSIATKMGLAVPSAASTQPSGAQ
jgi:hypothetical protein